MTPKDEGGEKKKPRDRDWAGEVARAEALGSHPFVLDTISKPLVT